MDLWIFTIGGDEWCGTWIYVLYPLITLTVPRKEIASSNHSFSRAMLVLE